VIRRIAALLGVVALPLTAQLPLPYGFAVSPSVSLRIWVPAGKVRVDTWDRDSIRVTGAVGAHTHLFGAASQSGAKLGIESDKPGDPALPFADIVVTVPRRAHVWVKMTDGAVTATNTSGELEVYTVTGSVTVQDAAGVVSVEAIDAPVTLTALSGDVRVRGGGGKVVLSRIQGTLSVSTVSGDVDLSGTKLQDGRVETIGGQITVRGSVARDALLDLETHSGGIALFIDKNAVPVFALTTRSGKVNNALANVKGMSGQVAAHSFKGNINVTAVAGIEERKSGTPP
jgi:DUF4097 and DUF4098 domain-containing protein YvlB